MMMMKSLHLNGKKNSILEIGPKMISLFRRVLPKKLKIISFFNFRNRIFGIPSILIFAFLLSAKILYIIVIR